MTAVGNGVFLVGDDATRTAWAVSAGNARWVFLDGNVYVIEHGRGGGSRRRGHGGSLTAPMPASVRKINVNVGDAVEPGDVLIVLDAMKMELPVRAPARGVIKALHCSAGELVQPGVSLVTLEDA